MSLANLNLDYQRPIKISDDVYWVGFFDTESGLHCNPYLIVDGDEAVVIDGGSRPHFPVVMMKILQTGIDPSAISALIYQHYDPDLCGSVSNFEDIINRPDLKIISDANNNTFIRHYSISSALLSLEKDNHVFQFKSGRRLKFFNTPYCHSVGSFVTFDERSGILFTSDIFGSYGSKWELFLETSPDCLTCRDHHTCPRGKKYCPFPDITRFHKNLMPSTKALRFALETMAQIPFNIIAPQHGSVTSQPETIRLLFQTLYDLKDVGIDGVLNKKSAAVPGDIKLLLKRFSDDQSA